MHPFIHPFAPAISAPWESRSDWDIFKALSKAVSDLAEEVDMELGERGSRDAAPPRHDAGIGPAVRKNQ